MQVRYKWSLFTYTFCYKKRKKEANLDSEVNIIFNCKWVLVSAPFFSMLFE